MYGKLPTTPTEIYSVDHISFTLTLDIHKCLLATFDDQVFADQTFTIKEFSTPTQLVYKSFEDWVTRDKS